jgi:hypothetical protein
VTIAWAPLLLALPVWCGVVATGMAASATVPGRHRRHRVDATVALLLAVPLTLVCGPLLWTTADVGHGVRLLVVGPHYRAMAERLLAAPAPPEYRTGVPYHDPFVAVDAGGTPVSVGWIWADGEFLGPSGGVAYSPHRPLGTGGSTDRSLHFHRFGGYRCTHLFGDWYDCSFE